MSYPKASPDEAVPDDGAGARVAFTQRGAQKRTGIVERHVVVVRTHAEFRGAGNGVVGDLRDAHEGTRRRRRELDGAQPLPIVDEQQAAAVELGAVVLAVGEDGERAFRLLPADLRQVRTQLQALRGRTHEVVAAVCAVQDGSRLWHGVSRSRLTMRNFTDVFLDDYIAALLRGGADVFGSVGAYRLEGKGVQLFEVIEGDHFAILGLPLLELLGFLRTKDMILP